ncbi:DNA repair protein RadA [Mycolicibacterium conceptionense]|uniref:DNA repair protein RadA n=1 Tax=Mycolicibacterium conceptionense TaxID=451644 RepID=A0A0U1DXP5_9MYCO|nr:DNA repair protein RadA [Mycolicibacterium conceptionense]
MIGAVLQTRCGLPIGNNDIYLSTVGGMRLTDPSSDLAVAVAVASAYLDIALPMNAVVIGEVGLVGDLRRVTGMDRRLAEAARLGFNIAVVPPGSPACPRGCAPSPSITSGRHYGHSKTSRLPAINPITDNSGRPEENRWP